MKHSYSLFRNRVVWVLMISTIISFCFFLAGIDSWKFALTGDDWQFYSFALDIIGKHFWLNPFSFAGVYEKNSVLASMYQALFLRLFDHSVISWRFSNVILIIPSSLFFYFFVKLYFGRLVGMYSTLLMQFSFFLANYFKIGYINPQCFPLLILCLYLSALLGMYPKRKYAVFLGLSLGVSFYIYMGPLFPLLIWPYLLPLFRKSKLKQLIRFMSYIIGCYILVVFPVLFNLNSVHGPLRKTPLASEETLPISVSANVLHEFLVFFREYQTYFNHFISGPYVDILTQVFLVIGVFLSIRFILQRKYLFLLLSYTLMTVILGLTNVYQLPPVTHGFLVLPYGFIFAGLGIDFISKLFRGRILREFFGSVVLLLIIFLNIYMSQIGVFRKTGYTTSSLVLKSLQDAKANGQNRVYFVISEKYSYSGFLGNFSQIQKGYLLSNTHLIIIRPELSSCQNIAWKNVIVLEQDKKAMQWLDNSQCMNHPSMFSVLQPDVIFY